MSMLHEESHPVIFRLDRKGLCKVHRLNAVYVEFIASGGSLVLSKLAGHNQR